MKGSSHIPLNNAQPTVHAAPSGKYNDVWATVLFALHFVAFIVISYFGIDTVIKQPQTNATTTNATQPVRPPLRNEERNALYGALGGGVFLSFLICVGYVVIMRRFGKQIIHVSLVMNIVLTILVGVLCLLNGDLLAAGLNFLFVLLNVLWYFFVKSRIPLASLIMGTVCDINSKYRTHTCCPI